MSKVYLSTIDKDVRRVLGKKLYKQIEEENGGWIIAERSNGDAEYHLNYDGYAKLRDYMLKHRNSRLSKSWTGCKDRYNVRFEVDSWQ